MTHAQTNAKANQPDRRKLVPAVCLLLLLAFAVPTNLSKTPPKNNLDQTNPNPASQAPVIIRVGAIYYDDSDEQYSKIRAILSALEKQDQTGAGKTRRPVTFKLAIGTYDEVLNWYESAQIDLAIMNPGPLALLVDKYRPEELNRLFVGIRSLTPAPTSFAVNDGGAPRSEYNSVMLLNRQAIREKFPVLSTRTTLSEPEAQQLMEFVFNAAGKDQVHFLFVHPFSTSGYIYPRKLLKDAGIKLKATDYDLTYSHDVSREQIRNSGSDNDRLTVAFVSDETAHIRDNDQLLAIRAGKLNKKIVQDALLLTQDFVEREPTEVGRVMALLKSRQDPKHTFNLKTDGDWLRGYQEVKTWIGEFSNNELLMSNSLTMDQIIRRLNNYNLHHPEEPARLALVLSGGGAKCAYQLGAVEVIEDKLGSIQKTDPKKTLGIDLVVGTSGGAINALTVAAEVTKDSNRRKDLKHTWESFGQSEILKASDIVQKLLGLSLGFIVSLFIVYAANDYQLRRSVNAKPARSNETLDPGVHLTLGQKISNKLASLRWHERTGLILLVLSLILYVLKKIAVTSQLSADAQLRYHVWIHISEYVRQTLAWAAFAIFISGAFLCIDLFLSRKLKDRYAGFGRNFRLYGLVWVVSLTLVLLFGAAGRTLMIENSLFVSDGIQEKMAVEFPRLLGSASSSQVLADISKEIIQNDRIKRDLVITGSMLPSTSDSASTQAKGSQVQHDETDLYFFYKAGPSPDLPETVRKDNRFVSLRDRANESILLDAVIGSGSIFPAFEPRRLSSVKRVMDKEAQKDVYIIDGGFVHNSPIEAAVQLRATHIIVIEASPEDRTFKNENLLTNSFAAFNHLFTQAQILDARSQRRAEIFTLRPNAPGLNEPPFLCTLDFGSSYIDRAMSLGKQDAGDDETPRFVRQPRPAGL